MANAPIQAPVDCTDGAGGESRALIVNPLTHRLTHVVVRPSGHGASERLVPIEQVAGFAGGRLQLRCLRADLDGFEAFTGDAWRQVRYAATHEAPVDPTGVLAAAMPTDSYYVHERIERVPPGEIAVSAGTRVQARDGDAGHVAELVIDPAHGEVTHLVLEYRHGLGQERITLPLSAVERVGGNVVYLKLDRAALATLPAVPAPPTRGPWAGARVELAALLFEDPAGADAALNYLRELEGYRTLKVRHAAVVVKRPDGQVVIQERDTAHTEAGALAGAVVGGIAGLLTGGVALLGGALAGAAAGGVAGHLTDRGFSARFLHGLAEHLQPGRAALLVVVQDDWAVSLQQALADQRCVFLQQELTDELVADLLGQSGHGLGAAGAPG